MIQNTIKTFAILAFVLMFATSAFAFQDYIPTLANGVRAPVDKLFNEPLSEAIKLVYEDKFQESLIILDSLQTEFPDHPAPYFYKAAAYQSWMSSYRFSGFQKELEENVELAIEKGKLQLELRKDDPWINFYIGAAYGYRAFFRVRKYNWIGAFMDGNKGVDNFRDALEKQNNMYDVYLGLGSYHYWRTARSKFIKAIAFWMKDLREHGIDQIRFSMDHGRYTNQEGALVLATVLYDHKKYDDALKVLNEYSRPETEQIMSTLYLRGRIYASLNRWNEAGEQFKLIEARLNEKEYSAIGYKVECKYWIAKSLAVAEKYTDSLIMTGEAIFLGSQRDEEKEFEGQFESFEEMLENIKTLQLELAKKRGNK